MTGEDLSLVKRGDKFLLTRRDEKGKVRTILLSEENLDVLVQSSRHIFEQIFSQRSGGNVRAVLVTPVRRVGLATDAHCTEICLYLYDPTNFPSGFSLDLAIAKSLSEGLAAYVSRIETATLTRLRQ